MSDYIKELFGANRDMDEIRSISKSVIESFELWSRRLINDKMTLQYGKDYFDLKLEDGNSLIKGEITKTIEERMRSNPERFPRMIDAILIDDISYFLCKEDFYKSLYKNVLEPYFSGREEVKNRIDVLKDIRNKLNHGNPISVRESQRAICYSNDFIDTYKDYYKKCGREKDFNVPTFIKAEDSYGRCIYRKEGMDIIRLYTVNVDKHMEELRLRPGDVYEIWVDVDNSYPADFYDIIWFVNSKKVGEGKHLKYVVSIKDVRSYLIISAELRSHRKWHLSGLTDDWLTADIGTILPPLEDET